MKVKDVMRSSVVTLSADDNLSVADDVMNMGRIWQGEQELQAAC